MNVLVTGGTGFVGSNIARRLLEHGHAVLVYDFRPPDRTFFDYIKPWEGKLTVAQGDIADWSEVSALKTHPITHIIHAAAHTGILPHIERSQGRDMVRANMLGAANVAELAGCLRVDRLIYTSSNSVYGDCVSGDGLVLHERVAPHPDSLYAISKFSGEMLFRRFGELLDFPVVIARLGTLFGPMERPSDFRRNQSLVAHWANSVLNTGSILVRDLETRQCLSYVEDVAEAVTVLLTAADLRHDLYNVNTGTPLTIGELVEILRELKPSVHVSTSDQAPEPGTSQFMVSERLFQDTGFRPQVGTRAGIGRYLAWLEPLSTTE